MLKGKKRKEKDEFIRSKPHCNIGTIGHVDHGKTTLTAAITKVLALSLGKGSMFRNYESIDNQVEERRRGITINATHVEYETKKRHYSHVDCPGHRDYIKNMITGAAQMDGVILVISVTEGPQEQTREHVILAREVGIEYMVVYVNKMDALKERDLKDLVEFEIYDLLDSYSFLVENLPFVFGSAREALEEREPSPRGTLTIVTLMEYVDDFIPQPERPVDKPLLVSIEGSLTVHGRGTVVTGKVERGIIKKGDLLEVVGATVLKTSCLGLEMFNKVLEYAEAGENVGVLLRHIKRSDIKRGFVLAVPGTVKPVRRFEAKAYVLLKEEGGRGKPFMSDYKPQFFFRTASVTGTITLLGFNMFAMPGDTVDFEVVLFEKYAIDLSMRFTLREGKVTVGAGFVTKV